MAQGQPCGEVGPAPRGPGALLSVAIRRGPCAPAVSREQGASCTRGSAPHRVPVLSAGDVFQLPLPLRGAGLLPGPRAAASRGRRWHPAHVHSQGKGLEAPTAPWAWSAPCSRTLREDLPGVRPQGDAGDGAWALPSGLQGEGQRIHLGEIRGFREDVTRESSLREQMGFQGAARGHCSHRNHRNKSGKALNMLEAVVGSQVWLGRSSGSGGVSLGGSVTAGTKKMPKRRKLPACTQIRAPVSIPVDSQLTGTQAD